MKGVGSLAVWAILISLCLSAVSAPAADARPQPTFRNLTRKYFTDGDGKALAELVGFRQPPQKVIALKYKVVMLSRDEAGKPVEKVVDPKQYEFKLGDQVRVEVEPYADYYIYIFHIGASGEHCFLVPAEAEDAPLAGGGKKVTLPGDGFFEFSPPPGKEQLYVVATEKPVGDRAVLGRVLTKKPGEKLSPEELEMKRTLKATRKALLISVQEQTKQILDKTVLWRGVAKGEERAKLVQDVRTRGVKEGTFEEPDTSSEGGTSAVYMSTEPNANAKLLVSIPLESKGEK